ncbi:MAG: hypothetical protein KatS3mg002_0982 [Candidatus Woesearchaeota archaeon]|nr:MAG: hypothetical protein KatS3mg002_0982 [Candidatus Woesearchaeota archaeon]
MKKNILIYFLIFLPVLIMAATFMPQTNLSWERVCEGKLNIERVENGILVKCIQEDTPIPTTQPTSTNTPIPTPESTIIPNPTPTPISGVYEPYPDAPLCEEHHYNEYHSLFNPVLGCHYDHTHGDNPHLLDDVFGTEVYDLMGGEISYEWHTPQENEEIKHKSYIWLVEKDLPCYSQFSNGCIIHYRAFVHNDLHNVFSTHHSALIEAYVCDELRYPTEGDRVCGRMLVSGHQLTGDLMIDNAQVLDRVEPSNAPRPVMLHYDSVGNKNVATWYPVFSSWMRISTEIGDMFGYYPIPSSSLPTDPSNLEFTLLTGNASKVQPHVISVGFSRANLNSIGVSFTNEFIDYRGFLNVMTARPDNCVQISAECSPLIIEHVPNIGQFQHRGEYKEFDIFFNNQSSNWIVFPQFAP